MRLCEECFIIHRNTEENTFTRLPSSEKDNDVGGDSTKCERRGKWGVEICRRPDECGV